ncbi:formylmethanofuran dehydrogenase subunit B [Candidatus Methanocrinis natronophilus]|uniref:Formylmethanofuran dehydrogenase subunit B n=1 Tax=Candidatus Methanocrinis natronophilus TaxID=3033396 RepID=A0ABT5X5F1_9EURY|nr:formylmethanofuran dehydrogenase subunit B [Candidatus Methanocrinis natronophilus]MDF0589910.1 formylmethanofuran dehydrogenase subunit B [Candidatus Methanocrinis natronophilus]
MIEEDVLCPFCGCLCDDLKVEVEEGRIVGVKRACRLGMSKFMGHERIVAPMVRRDGVLVETSYEEAYERAAEILKAAKRPLLYGWCSTVCETAKKGILLAEEVGGVIDSTATVCHGPSIIGIEEKGLAGSTLGQVKNRADLIVFWGANPAEAHPRHTLRYSSNSTGMFTPEGRGGRKVIVVDVRKTRTAKNADKFVLIRPGTDYEVIAALRMIVKGKGDLLPDAVAGIAKSDLEEVADMMKAAKFGAVLIGLGLTHSRGRYKNVDGALSLVADLNGFTKFVVLAMRGHYNVAGFGQVCAWETGYPMAVDLSRGAPYFNPGETAACDLLARREADAMMVVAADPASNFPRKTVEAMAEIPVIQVDPYPNPTTFIADVVIPTAVCGIEAEGTAYRMDGLSLRMKKVVDSVYPTDEEVVENILDRVRRLGDDN